MMIGLAVIGFVALLVLSSILNGYVLSVLWGWFFVPTLGLPRLSIVQAIGVAMVISYLTVRPQPKEKDKSVGESLLEGVTFAFFYPLFALLFGWVVHLFM